MGSHLKGNRDLVNLNAIKKAEESQQNYTFIFAKIKEKRDLLT